MFDGCETPGAIINHMLTEEGVCESADTRALPNYSSPATNKQY